MKTIIVATFIGQNNSLGYKNGHPYFLEIYQENHNTTITIQRMNSQSICQYSSLLTFLENWKDISKIHG